MVNNLKKENDKTPVRLLLVNNPITGLFMSARLDELSKKEDRNTSIYLHESRLYPLEYSSDINKKEAEQLKYITSIFGCNEFLNPRPIFYPFYSKKDYLLDLIEIFIEQLNNLKYIEDFLKENDLFDREVNEIWYGNCIWQNYLHKIFPKARLIKFDHGLTETLNYFSVVKNKSNYFAQRVNNFGKVALNAILPVGICSVICEEHITLHAREINKAMGVEVAKLLSNESVLKVARESILEINCDDSKTPLAIVLLENIKPWTNDEDVQFQYFSDFEIMLCETLLPILLSRNIKKVYFKAKLWHEEFSREAVGKFSRLSKHVECCFFTDDFGNFPLECYLATLNVKVLVGDLSSGLYYAKQLIHQIETFTFDLWFVQYTKERFGVTFPDLPLMRKILIEENSNSFSGLNPINLDVR
jgi:hypothetical protein